MTSSLAQLRLVEARRQNDAARRARELRQNYGVHFYRPHWKQHRFHELAAATGRYCRFGNRTGKTVCGSAEDVAWLLGGRVWYRSSFDVLDGERRVVVKHVGSHDHPLVRSGIPAYPLKGLLVASDWDKAKEIFTNREGSFENRGELFQLIPTEALGTVHKNRGGNIDMIEVKRLTEFGGGSSLLFIDTVESFKHAWRSAESSDFDFIHYDEPPPQKMFIANKRGLTDRNGKFWINATPVEELWVNDEFCPMSGTNVKVAAEGLRFRKTERGGDRFIITASIYDNPYISDEGRGEFEASLSAEEKECRLFGLPLNLSGLVYKEYHEDEHKLHEVPAGWADYHLPPLDYTIRVAWDVHDAIPQAILLVATAPTGESFVYDELFFSKLINENMEALKEKLEGRFVLTSLIDPRAVIESPVTGESILDTLAAEGLYFDLGSKDMKLGIDKTREKLKSRTLKGHPTIYFCPTVQRTLWEISRYCYNHKTMKPVDKDDHMVENLRRLVLTGLDYVVPPRDEDYIPKAHRAVTFAEDLVGV
jgi:hypothetical protein